MHNLKVENYVLFNGHTEDRGQEDSLSDSEGLFSRCNGGARIERGFCKTPRKSECQKITVNRQRMRRLYGITDSMDMSLSKLWEFDFQQALGIGDGQGILACCSPWGRKESDMTERLN